MVELDLLYQPSDNNIDKKELFITSTGKFMKEK